ncbi:MAG: extensin family protein [Pseudomonadota bacterium]
MSKFDSWNPFTSAKSDRGQASKSARTASRDRKAKRKSLPHWRRGHLQRPYNPPESEAWRAMGEQACIASGAVQPSPFIKARSSLGGPVPACGAHRPFVVTAIDNGRVRFTRAATVRCPMVPALELWTQRIVAPAAIKYLGSPVTRMRVISSYACRRIAGSRGKLSEHGRANAIDIAAFETADGRVITLKRGWRGRRSEAKFLRAVHRGACRYFTTVLGPNYNRAHHDHFHLDLARHGRTGTYRVCR